MILNNKGAVIVQIRLFYMERKLLIDCYVIFNRGN